MNPEHSPRNPRPPARSLNLSPFRSRSLRSAFGWAGGGLKAAAAAAAAAGRRPNNPDPDPEPGPPPPVALRGGRGGEEGPALLRPQVGAGARPRGVRAGEVPLRGDP
jgi:hypothetical protein